MGASEDFGLAGGWGAALAAAIGMVAMVFVGGLMTDIGPWYSNLKFPAWKPPNWAFGPIWTVILVMAGIGVYLAWRALPSGNARLWFAAALLLNGILNVFWNYLFFRLKRPDLAFFEVIALWLSILLIVVLAARVSATAALFFAPYLIWVAIAAMLNRSIVRLNGPF
ncbi:MAG: tryptophan-rich sensory protein [Methylocystis sp.]|jgi:benzodiazapine receptor|nr:tryptophan-rich sensory protein [Methylocystis sp.]MCA3583727.1 tryptophan-rich sensory protein [Methylocystis sp.]MCA3587739.1 tryptophan-rich sensory protein [Methylocystis sp.]MCA3589999.1 tryptophan-rich sensory protein [Methylocystis sp.]